MSDLARTRLVLSAGRPARGWLSRGATLVAALLVGASGTHLYWSERVGPLQQQAASLNDLQQSRQALEQSRLQLRVSGARSQELERQIDALNQRLRECQEEVTFFRKARDGKH
jgi:septal ring factor EnvC (AmiA/AmiB activator)